MGNFSGTLSHIVTTIPITQVTDVPEAASSSLVGHSTSACSLLLSDDNDHPLIFSRPEKVDDHSANSNNNNYKNAIPAGIVGRHDGVNFEKFDSQDSNTSSSALPSVESQSKPVLWKNEESLNVTVQLDKLTDYLKRDEANEPNANGKTEVTNVSRDGNREPKEQQSHYKGIQAVPEDSSQSKIQLVLGEMISSLDYEPCSNGDESDDSDAYIRRRLIEINAKFAQEPLPSDKGQVRETKVAFKKQLIDLVAPSPDFSRTEPADVRLEWSGAWEKVADSCDSVLSEDFSQPIVHESSPHLENVQVNIPAVKILNAVRPIQSVNAEELTAIKQEANMGDSAKRAAISRPITTVSPRNYFVGSTILNPVRNNTSKKPAIVQSSELHLRPKSAWQTSLGNEKSHGEENPRIIAVKTWIEEKNRIQRAKRRDELEQQIKEEEDRKQKQVLDQELREKHWFAWLKAKSKKVREERELKRRQEAERTYFAVAHTKKECDRAFHEWLRRKAVEQQQRLQDVRHRLKITRQVMQTCRTTQKWTRVIDQAKIYKLI